MIARLSDYEDGAVIRADLLVIGGGPVGLTIAAQCAAQGRRVLVVESGLEAESADHASLNAVESVGEPSSPAQLAKRAEFHGAQSGTWSQEAQPYGVRCRALGGSTHAWAGKSAPFDEIDFAERAWVPDSGWPIGRDAVLPYVRRAMDVLNLCPEEPCERFTFGGLHSQYWQFARSRVDRLDVMRFGREFCHEPSQGVDVLLDATVTGLELDPDGTAVRAASVQGLCGRRVRLEARFCVLAAGGIENARLLLASNDVHPAGIGNGHDLVGRYLMDHIGARIAEVPVEHAAAFVRQFGFFGVGHDGRAHMFMHGLALTPEMQEREGLLNAAIYFLPRRAPDDPWDALKRLIRRQSPHAGKDLLSTARGMGLLVKGIGMRVLTDERTPQAIKEQVVNAAIRLFPNMAAEEFVNRGVPHKVTGVDVDAICEQVPNRDSRITLSRRRDRFGVPLASVDWRINEAETRSLLRISELASSALRQSGLPAPKLVEWAERKRPQDCVIIDMAHTLGTTRMAASERDGVVDADCRVHGTRNLFVAGGSVFPTSGHANPTLMMLAFAIRLADHLNGRLAR